jgi:hypothetical protein
MRQSCEARVRARGGARLNFLIVMTILVVGGFVGFQTVPAFYRAGLLRTYMQDTVNNAAYLSKTPAWVEQQLRANGDDYDMPRDALIEAGERDGRMQAHVQFTRPIPLIVTTYQYKFDHTVKSSALTSGG